MLIRRPVSEVFEAFRRLQPSSGLPKARLSSRLNQVLVYQKRGKLEEGHIRWDWEMYGVHDDVYVQHIEVNRRIAIESSDQTKRTFTPRGDHETFVAITHSGF